MRNGSGSAGLAPARVLFVIVDLTVGGAEDHLLSLVRDLDRDRYQPSVCCIGQRGPIGEEIESAGVPVAELRRLRKGGFDHGIVALLRERIRREKIDLVHSHMYHANLYGRLAAFREDVGVVASIHNTYVRTRIRRRLLNRWLARRTPVILAGSEAIRRDILRFDGVPPHKVRVVPYGVDVDRFDSPLGREEARTRLDLPQDGFLVGTVGRLEEQKGQSDLVAAVARLRKEGVAATLLLVGSGREETRLREQARREGIAEHVLFLGTRRDLPELFRAMDVFAFPSLWEGFPIALLSAMAAGLPVVVTPVGGVPEVVRHGANGLVVPVGDPRALAEAIRKAHDDPAAASALGRSAAATVRERYSQKRTALRIMDIYDEVLGGGGRRTGGDG
jgi:glycosyltransferase involved in cell wall biosynthesis